MKQPICRFCGANLYYTVVDLGMSPLCESYLRHDQLNSMEPFYPLHVYVCDSCFLVQLQEYVAPTEIFSDYAYFSSYAESWLQHARAYAEMIVGRLALSRESHVVEIASNDGYLLQYFVAAGIPVLGVEPAANVAREAVKKGIPTEVEFFTEKAADALVASGKQADLLIGNNVLAQVPDLNGFVAGLKRLLKPQGTITLEFPHLLQLMEGNQFDTIYHEHFSYFSFITVGKILAAHGLMLFDVEELSTHGGSLRIYACHVEDRLKPPSRSVIELRGREAAAGLTQLTCYASFEARVKATKHKLLEFLIRVKQGGKSIVGYGAPGKGNTLLNYCGIGSDFLDYTVDRSPHKQGKFLPGTHIPIFHPDRIAETRPDCVLLLPWNLKQEIMDQLSYIREWGGQFVVPIPAVHVCP
jgi:SAM-dependent methyltransferase